MKHFFLILALVPCALWAQNEEAFRRALDRNPKNIDVHLAYIKSLSNSQRITEAGNEALAAVGERFDLHTAIGDALFAAGDARRAVNAYRRAQALNPRSATGFNRLGLALMRLGSYRQAEVSFKAASGYTGSINARAAYLANLGQALENSEEWDQASKAYAEALKVNPANAIAKDGRDRLLSRVPKAEATN